MRDHNTLPPANSHVASASRLPPLISRRLDSQEDMAFLRVLLISLAVAAVTADLPTLPDFMTPPASCGSVTQVQAGDTCNPIA